MYCCSEICIATLKYVLLHQYIYIATPKYVIQTACTRSQTITIQYNMGTAPRTIHSGLVPAPRPLTVLIPGSHRVPPLVPTRRKVLSLPKTFAGSRRPPTGHHRVPPSTIHTKSTTRWHTVGLAGTM